MSVYEIRSDVYNEKLAEALKQMAEFKMPEWACFVKTSTNRERPPLEGDWWYKRAASILRQLYIHEVVGVGRLRTRYGGRKDRGQKPERFKKGSGKIIRVILQQAEAAGFVEKFKTSKKAGRKLTEKGKEFLDNINLSSLVQENSQKFSEPQKRKVSEEKKTSLTKEETKSEEIKLEVKEQPKEVEETKEVVQETKVAEEQPVEVKEEVKETPEEQKPAIAKEASENAN